mmetsp:Transcript_14497/g.27844  ORF Transcript_14497/g.27844 Transcript_14497/m.27844 type:complete len:249 (-) Transcript_14497:416-1162(-)|eukprot:CAMPEP_0114231412 /NCGR_PEP_ID=MMETSP0058-20121206/4027_1 /TAXON_ID=36894 /ORGANISM="Pyramimonas parkeae, CCMP726" /LENGTH=248 /DNA_ID=CAMNT_0001342753 /DNA_START=213 /DNA_END=959 /DNA_ORIENTATION=-
MIRILCKASPAVQHTLSKPPARHFVDISIEQPAKVEHLSFRNHYVAHIIVKAKGYKENVGVHKNWTTILPKYLLMTDPHYEDDAQNNHIISLPMVLGIDLVAKLRIYLVQPSPRWHALDFKLEHIFAYTNGDVSSIQQHLADSSDFTDSHTMTSWNAIQRASASHQVERSRQHVGTGAFRDSTAEEAMGAQNMLGSDRGVFLENANELRGALQTCWSTNRRSGTPFTIDRQPDESFSASEKTVFIVGA